MSNHFLCMIPFWIVIDMRDAPLVFLRSVPSKRLLSLTFSCTPVHHILFLHHSLPATRSGHSTPGSGWGKPIFRKEQRNSNKEKEKTGCFNAVVSKLSLIMLKAYDYDTNMLSDFAVARHTHCQKDQASFCS